MRIKKHEESQLSNSETQRHSRWRPYATSGQGLSPQHSGPAGSSPCMPPAWRPNEHRHRPRNDLGVRHMPCSSWTALTLGLGILFPLFPAKADLDVIMNSVAPVWDGNETWLVLGGGGVMAAFPLAYSVLLPALYAPMIAMLIALVFRGVAFEFRWRAQGERNPWDLAFAGGSWLAALAQGIALGAILQGVHVEARHYAGGWWDWLTPFSILTGVSLVIGYALLGATWLVMKTEGSLRDRAYRLSWLLLIPMLGAIVAVSIATPFLHVPYHPHRAGADRGRRCHRTAAPRAHEQIRLPAVLPVACAVRTVLCRARHQHVSLYRAAEHHDLAGGVAGEQPDLHAVRRRRADPADPGLYRMGLLGVSRQGQA